MTLFKINNIYIKVNFSFLILCVIWIYAGQTGVLFTMIAVVLIHEGFHAFVARLFGFSIEKIELFLFGGAAEIKNINDNYVYEAIVAASGPFISLLSGFLWEKGYNIGVLPQWRDFVDFSLDIALINILPIYPLDGGRVLCSILKEIFGEKKGRKITVLSGITVSTVFLLKCLYELVALNKSSYIVMSVFMFTASLMSIKKPRRITFREKYWKSEKVKIIKAYESEKIIDCLNNMSGNCFFCVLIVDKDENAQGIYTEKQLLDGIMNNTNLDFSELPKFLNRQSKQ